LDTTAAAESTQQAPRLRIDRLRFTFEALEPMRLPAYTGSAWRGLLGRCLRQTVCVTRQPTCDGCLLLRTCVYSTFFESPAAAPEIAARYNPLPHPYVLEPDIEPRRDLTAGERLGLGMTLMGSAADLAPYLIHALQRAGERGLGSRGARFALLELSREPRLGSGDWTPVYRRDDGELHPLQVAPAEPVPCPPTVRLQLQTPLRIKHHGRFVGPTHLTAADLLRTLIGRIEILTVLYGAGSLDLPALHAAVPSVEILAADLRWHEWTRYSSRQQTSMQMGGLLGQIELGGDGLPALWPLLRLGQWTHLGKGTSFGLGRYRLW
jgi:hypothetical protein